MATSHKVVTKTEIKELQEEAFLILHSGETPEIAFHSALYYLFEDQDGPRLSPDRIDLMPLKRAVFERYKKILLRDLMPSNRDKRIYRGIARSIANWHRLKNFCSREGFSLEKIRQETINHLQAFLEQELKDISLSRRSKSSINCTFEELEAFAMELGIEPSKLPDGIEKLCRKS